MRHTIGVHNLRSTKLVLRVIHFTSKQLVQCRVTGEDNRSLLHLNHTLSQTNKVGSNANRPSRHITECEDLVVSSGCLASNLSTSLQVLYTNSVLRSNDIVKGPSFWHLVSDHRTLWELLVVSIRQVQVVESLGWVLCVQELDVDLRFEFVDKSDTSSGVTCDVYTRQLVLSGVHGSLVVQFVFLNTERTTLDSHIVGDDNNFATLGILRCLHVHMPRNHSIRICSNRS
mmetsp:Transcript_49264/g.73463  ORF Transcript_49264/g.73463 Transcript_49264/m.73463 type:complete len:229 (-) Transcript_49264:4376-5062(-)